MSKQSAAEEYEGLPLPDIESSLLDEFRSLMAKAAAERSRRNSPTTSTEEAKRPLRAEHERFVAKCMAELTDENALEVRARLRARNEALDKAEKKIDDLRTPEEVRRDEAEWVSAMALASNVNAFTEEFWARTVKDSPKIAKLWTDWYAATFAGTRSEPKQDPSFILGSLMLSQALVRRIRGSP